MQVRNGVVLVLVVFDFIYDLIEIDIYGKLYAPYVYEGGTAKLYVWNYNLSQWDLAWQKTLDLVTQQVVFDEVINFNEAAAFSGNGNDYMGTGGSAGEMKLKWEMNYYSGHSYLYVYYTNLIVSDEAINMVAFNNFKSAYEATELLIKLGHRRIAMIPGVFSASERAFRRWKGYKKCLEDYGIEYDADLVIQKMYSFYDGKEAMTSLLKKQPTAVFCGTDVTAIGALRAIHDAGLKAPDDISVIGYDDSEYATFAYPPLTTVRVPAYEMGRLAAKVLMEIIQDKTERPQRYILDTDLIIRESSGPAKST